MLLPTLQMVAIIDQNMQKYSESYNEVKGMQSKAAVAAAASQMLYDSVASEVARLKQDMEKLQNQAVTSKAQCHSATNSHLVASVSHERAVTTAKDVKSIDQELAVIEQLRQKLKELTAIKAVQTSNVQLDTSDSVARAISDASANMRPSTSLMLAEVIADVKNGRHFAETGEISKLLDQIVAKLNAERSQKVNDVSHQGRRRLCRKQQTQLVQRRDCFCLQGRRCHGRVQHCVTEVESSHR